MTDRHNNNAYVCIDFKYFYLFLILIKVRENIEEKEAAMKKENARLARKRTAEKQHGEMLRTLLSEVSEFVAFITLLIFVISLLIILCYLRKVLKSLSYPFFIVNSDKFSTSTAT